MENVVYILGAGFSAPLGLPVMGNFVEKSKDIYLKDQERYEHFMDVFKTIDKMGKTKTYYSADLTNIEEVLSILEMKEDLSQTRDVEIYRKFLGDVIRYFDPDICPSPSTFPSNWYEILFRGENVPYPLFQYFGYFVGSLLNVELVERADGAARFFWSQSLHNPSVQYSIITLNYDKVIENMALSYSSLSYFQSQGQKAQRYDISAKMADVSLEPRLAKLHGSIDRNDIVPPTWNKFRSLELLNDWQNAHDWLVNANQIRIIGYSLPIADSYIKYLLKAAILDSFQLRTIDVICKDPAGDVRQRFEAFVDRKYLRFVNSDVELYLKEHRDILFEAFGHIEKTKPTTMIPFTQLEKAHDKFVKERSNYR